MTPRKVEHHEEHPKYLPPSEAKEPRRYLYTAVYVKRDHSYLDQLVQGGIVEKTIMVRYYPDTGEVETEVRDYPTY